jgi:hypothetical protein
MTLRIRLPDDCPDDRLPARRENAAFAGLAVREGRLPALDESLRSVDRIEAGALRVTLAEA